MRTGTSKGGHSHGAGGGCCGGHNHTHGSPEKAREEEQKPLHGEPGSQGHDSEPAAAGGKHGGLRSALAAKGGMA